MLGPGLLIAMQYVYMEMKTYQFTVPLSYYSIACPAPLLQAGMQAVRENRYIILAKDFEKAYKKAVKKDDQEHDFYK